MNSFGQEGNIFGKNFVTLYCDSFSTDKEGNVTRKFIASSPTMDIKITKVMMGLRVV